MKGSITVSHHSDIPVYRQIVTHVTFMIEMGELTPGDRLPGSRLLAANLGINRNTVAHAYRELRALGLVEAHGRNGMVVAAREAPVDQDSAARARAREIIGTAVRECIALGLSPTEIGELTTGLAVRAAEQRLRIAFVECNADRAEYFARELDAQLANPVEPLVIGRFAIDEVDADLVLTTFFHLAEVRSQFRGSGADVVAIVVSPHIRTLVQIAQVPRDHRIGLWYSTEDQATSVRDSLNQAGLQNIELMTGEVTDEQLADLDLVIVPSEMPQFARRLEGRVRVIEFGNVLDAASVRMVREVIDDLQRAS